MSKVSSNGPAFLLRINFASSYRRGIPDLPDHTDIVSTRNGSSGAAGSSTWLRLNRYTAPRFSSGGGEYRERERGDQAVPLGHRIVDREVGRRPGQGGRQFHQVGRDLHDDADLMPDLAVGFHPSHGRIDAVPPNCQSIFQREFTF